MTLREFLEKVEVQCFFKVCYYDYDMKERIIVYSDAYMENTVRCIYVENNVLFIEVEQDY